MASFLASQALHRSYQWSSLALYIILNNNLEIFDDLFLMAVKS